MGARWRQRRSRYERWFNRLERADRTERNLGELLRRVLECPADKMEMRQRCSSQLDGLPLFTPNSSQNKWKKELLVDVFEDGADVVVFAELIGIDQSSINLHATEDKLVIRVDSPDLKCAREIELPAKVDVGSSCSSLKHGILEIRLRKLEEKLASNIK